MSPVTKPTEDQEVRDEKADATTAATTEAQAKEKKEKGKTNKKRKAEDEVCFRIFLATSTDRDAGLSRVLETKVNYRKRRQRSRREPISVWAK
jgi:hypothetical protein